MFQFPRGMMWNKNRVQSRFQGRINIASRTISHHPSVRFHDAVLVHKSRVSFRIFFRHNFNRREKSLQARFFYFGRLLRRVPRKESTGAYLQGSQAYPAHHPQVAAAFVPARRRAREFVDRFPLRHLSGQLAVRILQRTTKTFRSVSVLANINSLSLIQNSSRIIARIPQRLGQRKKILNRLFKEDVVLPERVVRIN